MDKAFVGLAILLIIGNLLSFATEGKKAGVTTELTVTLSPGDTTINVTSTSDFRDAGQLVVGEELISYTTATATTFTGLTREEEDSTAAVARIGTRVSESTLGLVTNMLDFRAAQSDVPLFGQLITGFNVAKQFLAFIGRVIIWDYSYWDSDIMGIPMRYGQFFMFTFSVGVVIRLFMILRSGGTPF